MVVSLEGAICTWIEQYYAPRLLTHPGSGSKKEVIQMLDLAVEKKVKSYIEKLPSKVTVL
jgi:hypothetical protein